MAAIGRRSPIRWAHVAVALSVVAVTIAAYLVLTEGIVSTEHGDVYKRRETYWGLVSLANENDMATGVWHRWPPTTLEQFTAWVQSTFANWDPEPGIR